MVNIEKNIFLKQDITIHDIKFCFDSANYAKEAETEKKFKLSQYYLFNIIARLTNLKFDKIKKRHIKLLNLILSKAKLLKDPKEKIEPNLDSYDRLKKHMAYLATKLKTPTLLLEKNMTQEQVFLITTEILKEEIRQNMSLIRALSDKHNNFNYYKELNRELRKINIENGQTEETKEIEENPNNLKQLNDPDNADCANPWRIFNFASGAIMDFSHEKN